MRTWKNRQRPSKKVHRKTVSRKQRGGGLIDTERVRAWIEQNPKQVAKYGTQVQTALAAGDQKIIIDDQDIRKVSAWEQSTPKSNPFGQVPQQPDPSSNAFAQGLRGPDLSMYRSPQAGELAASQSPAPAPAPVQPAPGLALRGAPTLANSLRGFRAPGIGSAPADVSLAPGATVAQANAAANSMLGPGADTRLGTALSGRNPMAATAPAVRGPQGSSGLIYTMSSSGTTQTIQDCNAQLAALREELERLKSGLVQTQATTDAQKAALEKRIAALEAETTELKRQLEVAKAANDALTSENTNLQSRLGAAEQALAGKGAAFDEASRKIAALSAELKTATELNSSQKEELGRISGMLAALQKTASDDLEKHKAEIARLIADHAAELARLKADHQAELDALNLKLQAEKEKAAGVKTTSAAEKDDLSRRIAELTAAIAAQKKEIDGLGADLRSANEALVAQQKKAEEDAAAAGAAAAAATQAAQAAATKLAELEASNAALRTQLEAARAAAAAAEEAASESDKGKAAAQAAADAAKGIADAATQAAAEAGQAAAAAAADSKASAGEKADAARAADDANKARDAALAAAEEAARKMNEAIAAAAEAARAKAEAEAKLHALQASTPRIIKIVNVGGDQVGGVGGGPAVLNEELTVTWEMGAEQPKAWVFVMFSGNTPAYTQLILSTDPFKFTSTVGGDINAVMFDVTTHSEAELGF